MFNPIVNAIVIPIKIIVNKEGISFINCFAIHFLSSFSSFVVSLYMYTIINSTKLKTIGIIITAKVKWSFKNYILYIIYIFQILLRNYKKGKEHLELLIVKLLILKDEKIVVHKIYILYKRSNLNLAKFHITFVIKLYKLIKIKY